jgi:plasmid stabilization system protein ParE
MKVVFHKDAVGDLEAIAEYIRLHSPAGARTVTQRIRTATQNLSQFSHFGRGGLEPRTRELVVRRTHTSSCTGLPKLSLRLSRSSGFFMGTGIGQEVRQGNRSEAACDQSRPFADKVRLLGDCHSAVAAAAGGSTGGPCRLPEQEEQRNDRERHQHRRPKIVGVTDHRRLARHLVAAWTIAPFALGSRTSVPRRPREKSPRPC